MTLAPELRAAIVMLLMAGGMVSVVVGVLVILDRWSDNVERVVGATLVLLGAFIVASILIQELA